MSQILGIKENNSCRPIIDLNLKNRLPDLVSKQKISEMSQFYVENLHHINFFKEQEVFHNRFNLNVSPFTTKEKYLNHSILVDLLNKKRKMDFSMGYFISENPYLHLTRKKRRSLSKIEKNFIDSEIQVSPENILLTGKSYINPKMPIANIQLNSPIQETIKLLYSNHPDYSFNINNRFSSNPINNQTIKQNEIFKNKIKSSISNHSFTINSGQINENNKEILQNKYLPSSTNDCNPSCNKSQHLNDKKDINCKEHYEVLDKEDNLEKDEYPSRQERLDLTDPLHAQIYIGSEINLSITPNKYNLKNKDLKPESKRELYFKSLNRSFHENIEHKNPHDNYDLFIDFNQAKEDQKKINNIIRMKRQIS